MEHEYLEILREEGNNDLPENELVRMTIFADGRIELHNGVDGTGMQAHMLGHLRDVIDLEIERLGREAGQNN